MTPSKSPHESSWSSTAIARRLSRGSVEGPFGTAHDLNLPATSSRKSKCMLVAACCWMTKRGIARGYAGLGLHAIARALDAGLLGAVGAAVHRAVRLDPVTDDPAAAVGAGGGDGVDRAFEAVEHVRLAALRDLHRLVVFVSAHLALGHRLSSIRGRGISYPGRAALRRSE